MCFTPTVSLSTALIEFFLAAIMPWKFPKATLRKSFAVFLTLLGFYQFTEFMLCVTRDAAFWVRAGFITYSFLPAAALHVTLNYFKIKINKLFVYFVPIAATVYALTDTHFVGDGVCNTIFITTHIALFQFKTLLGGIPYLVYITYYAGFILLSCGISLYHYQKEHSAFKKRLYLVLPIAVALMTIPTYVVLIIFPYLQIRFPSILCHFALLLAITFVVGVYMENTIQKNTRAR